MSHLESVFAIPVSAAFDQLLSLLQISRDEVVIHVEKADANLVENQIQLHSQGYGFFVGQSGEEYGDQNPSDKRM